MSSPSLVYVSFDRFPAPKGAAVHIRAFVEALGQAFGGVELLAIGGDVPAPPMPGVRFHPLGARGADLIQQALCFRGELAVWWRGRERASVVHVRSPFEGYPIARRKERLCEHLIFEVNGLPSLELKYHAPAVADDDELLRKLVAQEDYCLSRADLVLTPSEVTARYLETRGVAPGRVRVIPNGVDPLLFPFQVPRPWEGRPVRLLYSGTMTSWQGVHPAIEACRLLRRELPVRLTLVGPVRRRQRRELLERCGALVGEGAVELVEALPQAELARLHHACDAVLVPLLPNDRNLVQGCCPLKLLEAMASGTPVVASDLPVVRALAEPGVEGAPRAAGLARGHRRGGAHARGGPGARPPVESTGPRAHRAGLHLGSGGRVARQRLRGDPWQGALEHAPEHHRLRVRLKVPLDPGAGRGPHGGPLLLGQTEHVEDSLPEVIEQRLGDEEARVPGVEGLGDAASIAGDDHAATRHGLEQRVGHAIPERGLKIDITQPQVGGHVLGGLEPARDEQPCRGLGVLDTEGGEQLLLAGPAPRR